MPLTHEKPYPGPLDESNSIKLKKGNLVVRKAKTGVEELYDLQNSRGYRVIDHEKPYK